MRALLLAAAGVVAFAALATATPLACTSNCVVQASASTGYTAPVFELKSGSSLTWVSTDIGHISVDGAPLVASASPCVRDSVPGNLASQPARFDIRGGMLTATLGATTLTCGNAQALPDGSFELPYYCALHANMRGLLLVSP